MGRIVKEVKPIQWSASHEEELTMDDKTAMYEKGRSMMEMVLEIPFTDKDGPSRMAISMYTCFEGHCERPGYPEEFARGIIDAAKEKDMRLAKTLFCVLRKEPIEVTDDTEF